MPFFYCRNDCVIMTVYQMRQNARGAQKRMEITMGLLDKLFGSYTDRELKKIYPIADAIEALEPEMQTLSDEQLRMKTAEFKQRLAEGETLDDILPEAFAAVRSDSTPFASTLPSWTPHWSKL